MKTSTRRLIATALAAPIGLSVLAACGATEAPDANTAPAAAEQQPAEQAVVAQSPRPTSPNPASPKSKATAPQPPNTIPRFTGFNAPTTAVCYTGDDPEVPQKPEIKVSWASVNAVEAWYSPSTEDAKTDAYMEIPLSGNQDALTDEHLFPCFHEPDHSYTITLVGAHGEHVSKTWNVRDVTPQP